jgi:hypothetical protein
MPLSPGALPATNVAGGPPSFCARRSSSLPIMMFILSCAGRANRLNVSVHGGADKETANFSFAEKVVALTHCRIFLGSVR